MTPAAAAGSRLLCLDWIRGIAALSVVLYHAEIGSHSYLRPLVAAASTTAAGAGLWFGAGWLGVPVFFVLSGDVISRSLRARRQTMQAFLARRFWRLYPTYAALTVLFILLLAFLPVGAARGEHLSPGKILSSLAFGLGRGDGAYLYVAWTLFWEVGFYLLAAPFAPGKPRLPALLGVLGLPLIGLIGLLPPAAGLLRQSLSYLACFAAGVAVVALPAIFQAAPPRPRRAVVALLAYLLGLALLLVNPLGKGFGVAAGLASLVMLLAVALEQQRPGLFSHPWPRWLGQISYSLYLVQVLTVPAVMKALERLLRAHPIDLPFPIVNGVAILLALGLSLILAQLSWALLEVRLSRWLQRHWPAGRPL